MSNEGRATDIARRAIHGVVWTTIGNYAVQATAFVVLLILRTWIEPAVFGIFDLAAFWWGVLGVRSKSGIHYAVLRHQTLNGALIGTTLVIDGVTGAVGLAIAAIAGPVIAAYFGYESSFVSALLIIFASEAVAAFGGAFQVALERELQFRTIQVITITATFAGYAAALALGGQGMGILSLLVINALLWSIAAAASYFTCRRHMPHLFAEGLRFDPTIARALLRDGIATGVSITLIGTLVGQFDNFLNATYVDPTTQGIYGLAFKIANWPAILIAMVLSRVGYTVMAKVHQDRELLAQTIRLTYWIQGLLAIPFMLTLTLHAAEIVHVLYPTGKWDASVEYLPYLAVANMFNIYAGVGYWLAAARGHRRYTIGSALLQSALLIGLGSLLVTHLGAFGTTLAVLAAGVVTAVISVTYTLYVVGRSQVWPLAIHVMSGVACVILYLVLVRPSIAQFPPLTALLVGSAFIVIVYCTVYLALGGKQSVDQLRYLRDRALR